MNGHTLFHGEALEHMVTQFLLGRIKSRNKDWAISMSVEDTQSLGSPWRGLGNPLYIKLKVGMMKCFLVIVVIPIFQ